MGLSIKMSLDYHACLQLHLISHLWFPTACFLGPVRSSAFTYGSYSTCLSELRQAVCSWVESAAERQSKRKSPVNTEKAAHANQNQTFSEEYVRDACPNVDHMILESCGAFAVARAFCVVARVFLCSQVVASMLLGGFLSVLYGHYDMARQLQECCRWQLLWRCQVADRMFNVVSRWLLSVQGGYYCIRICQNVLVGC